MSPSPSYRYGPNSEKGGMDITISLTPDEADVLGSDAAQLADWFDTLLYGLALLRRGPDRTNNDETLDDLHLVIRDLDVRLKPRIAGIVDLATRRHEELGGSLSHLASAIDAAHRSTAQQRRKALKARQTSAMETWAGQDTTAPMPRDPVELNEYIAEADTDYEPVHPSELTVHQRRWLPNPIPADLSLSRCRSCGTIRPQLPGGTDPWRGHDDECQGPDLPAEEPEVCRRPGCTRTLAGAVYGPYCSDPCQVADAE